MHSVASQSSAAIESGAEMKRPWIASYGSTIPEEIDADSFPTLLHVFDAAVARYPDHTAFVGIGGRLTYAEVDREARAFAAFLQGRLGVRKGDRIAVMLPNILAFPIAMLGIIRSGAIQVNVNPMYTARELEHQLQDAEASVIVVYNGSTPTLAEVVGETAIKHVISVTPGDSGNVPAVGPVMDARLHDAIAFAEALHVGKDLDFRPVDIEGSDVLFLQYTGGTTGLSKGAVLTHRNLVANFQQFGAVIPRALRPGIERVVTALPLYHIFGLTVNLVSYFAIGATNWLVANPRDIDGLVQTLKDARPTAFAGVNTLYAALLATPGLGEVDFSELRLAAGGGASILPVTSAGWQKVTGVIIHEGYGLSETSPVLSFNPAELTEFNATVGLPLPSTDIRLIDDDGAEVAIGQTGEICAKGPQVMPGYWRNPDATAAAFTGDGYFRTGDIGQFDEAGFLRVVDRKKDMINVSGFNVYPNEVEAIASACPGVAECACIGTPGSDGGEKVSLFVVRSAGSSLTEAELVAHCRNELAAYKVPRLIHFVDALPKSTVGKILRRELRAVTGASKNQGPS